MFRKLYDWTMGLAGSRQAPAWLAGLSFAESSFFPIPPDGILAPMVLAKPNRAFFYAGICTASSVLGGLLGYAIGMYLQPIGLFILKLFGHPEGQAEIGYYPIRPTSAGLALVSDWPEQVYQWHREGFDQPRGSELLAEGDMFEVQAFRYRRSFALQFHPDVTHAMMHRWTTRGHARLELPGARARHHHFADRAVHDVIERAWLAHFIQDWLRREPAQMLAQAAE